MRTRILVSFWLAAVAACSSDGPGGSTPAGDVAVDSDVGADVGGDAVDALDTGDDAGQDGDATGDVVADADVDTGPVVIPETPVGAHLAWILDVVNGVVVPTVEEAGAHLSPAQAERNGDAVFHDFVTSQVEETAPWRLAAIAPESSDTGTVATIEASDAWYYLVLGTVEEDPYGISVYRLNRAPAADPDNGGPMAANEFGARIWEPRGGQHLDSVTAEAVDRATGESFTPPTYGVFNELEQWARFTLPEGVTDAAIRVTHPDGFVTTTTTNFSLGGFGMLGAPTFDGDAAGQYLERLGEELDPEKGHVWGWVSHQPSARRPWLPGWVGCATVSLSPDAGAVYYTAAPFSLPDADLDHTDPVFATWFAFNVSPGDYVVTVTADGGEQTSASFAVRAGEFTLVVTAFSAEQAPDNPTPADCADR